MSLIVHLLPKSWQKARNSRRQAGGVIVESAFALPLLVLLAAGSIDLGNYFLDYLEMSQVAYEGSRLCSKLALIEDEPTSQRGVTCSSNGGTTRVACTGYEAYLPGSTTNHAIVHSRMELLTRLTAIRRRGNTIGTKVDLDRANDTVEVTVSTTHVPVWGFLPGAIPLVVKSKATYLY